MLTCRSEKELDDQIRARAVAVGRAVNTYEQTVRAGADPQAVAGAFNTLRRSQVDVMAAIDAKEQCAFPKMG